MADLPPQIRSKPHQRKVITNLIDANKCKVKRYLNVEDIFGFCKSFKNVTKNRGFHLTLKAADLHDIIYTSMTDDINVTINNFYLFILNLIPYVETQSMFNGATQNNYKISYNEYFTERRVISDSLVHTT